MSEKFGFENKPRENNPEADSRFQESYEPQEVTLEELKEKMRRLAHREGRKEE